MNPSTDITLAEAMRAIQSTAGQTFGATWTKKDGSLRVGSLRLGVRKGVKGVGLSYDPSAHGLLGCFDMNKTDKKTGEKGAFIMLKIAGLQSLRIDGEVLTVG